MPYLRIISFTELLAQNTHIRYMQAPQMEKIWLSDSRERFLCLYQSNVYEKRGYMGHILCTVTSATDKHRYVPGDALKCT